MLGALIGGAANVASTAMTNAANARQARLNREFQERMSSTEYQRSMADMRASGLNPIMAAKTGGASTPPGASAVMQDYGDSVSSAVDASRLENEQQQVAASTDVAKSQAALNRELDDKAREDAKLSAASARAAEAQASYTRAQERALSAKQPKADISSKFYKGVDKLAERVAPAAKSSAREVWKASSFNPSNWRKR